MRIFSSAEWCRHGLSSPHGPGTRLPSLLLGGATMSQTLLTQSAHFIRQALTAYNGKPSLFHEPCAGAKKSKARISSRACSRITLVVTASPSRGHASDARTRTVLGDIASSTSADRHNRSSPCSSGVPCMPGDRYQLRNQGPEGKLLAPLQPSHRSRQSRRRCCAAAISLLRVLMIRSPLCVPPVLP